MRLRRAAPHRVRPVGDFGYAHDLPVKGWGRVVRTGRGATIGLDLRGGLERSGALTSRADAGQPASPEGELKAVGKGAAKSPEIGLCLSGGRSAANPFPAGHWYSTPAHGPVDAVVIYLSFLRSRDTGRPSPPPHRQALGAHPTPRRAVSTAIGSDPCAAPPPAPRRTHRTRARTCRTHRAGSHARTGRGPAHRLVHQRRQRLLGGERAPTWSGQTPDPGHRLDPRIRSAARGDDQPALQRDGGGQRLARRP